MLYFEEKLAYTSDNKYMAERIETKNQAYKENNSFSNEKAEMVDVQKRAESHSVPREVESWLHKLETDPTQIKTVSDDQGQPLLQTTVPQNPKITLPTTRTKFLEGFRKKATDAGRWLSTFVLRMIKIKGGKAKFKEE